MAPGGPTHGLITVCREGRRFTEDDLELLRSLAAQATLAMANVNLHFDVQRQAITDDLTGLATHGHFQDLLSAEMEEVRRYQLPGRSDHARHRQLQVRQRHPRPPAGRPRAPPRRRRAARRPPVTSTWPARYGGEEMALILPHTDLEGAYEIAERARMAIAAMKIPLIEGEGSLRVTASVGAAASSNGAKNDLIAAADAALYVAKREGKNRTVRAEPDTANVVSGE